MNLPDISQQKPIGKGSSRTVYLMGNCVAKVARGRYKRFMRGLAQNRAEYEIWKYATSERGVTHLCPIIDITPDDEILIMAKATPISNLKEIPESVRKNLRLFKRRLRYIHIAMCGKHRHQINTEKVIGYSSNPKTRQEMRRTFKSKLWYDIQTLVYDYGLVLGDIVRPSSWGYYKGRFVMVDYGGTKRVLEEYYDRHFTPGIAV